MLTGIELHRDKDILRAIGKNYSWPEWNWNSFASRNISATFQRKRTFQFTNKIRYLIFLTFFKGYRMNEIRRSLKAGEQVVKVDDGFQHQTFSIFCTLLCNSAGLKDALSSAFPHSSGNSA